MPTLLSASACENPIPGEEEEALDLDVEMQIGNFFWLNISSFYLNI